MDGNQRRAMEREKQLKAKAQALADKQAAAEAQNIPCDPTLSSSTHLGIKVEKQHQEELAARQQREAEAAASVT